MTAHSRYVMDDPREAARLADKVDSPAWVRRYLAPLLPETGRVLDVGCGPGHLAAEVACSRPGLEVVGVDLSAERLAVARKSRPDGCRLDFKQGDAVELPLAEATCDLTYCRFLLEYLGNRERAVAEMVRVTRTGGRVLLQDLDGQLVWHHPMDPTLAAGIQRVTECLAGKGFDVFTGRKLYSLLYDAGVRALQVAVEPYHLHAGAIESTQAEFWRRKLQIAKPAITEALGSREETDALVDTFMEHLADPRTLTYSVVFTVHGVKS